MYTTEWNIDPDSKRLFVPRSIVQPLVENALFHGILPTGRTCVLTISTACSDNTIHISVKDDGEGMSEETLRAARERMVRGSAGPHERGNDSMKSIGLRNIYMRLSHIYGNDFDMSIESSAGEGTQVELILPGLDTRTDLKSGLVELGGNT